MPQPIEGRTAEAREESVSYTEYGFVFYSQDDDSLSRTNQLFSEGVVDPKRSAQFDYRLEVIENFKKIVPNFGDWLLKQTKDGYLYGRRLDFVKDILKFVTTGKREVSVSNWEALLDPFEDIYRSNSVDKKKALECLQEIGRKTPFPDTDTLIIKWCSKDDGFNDMLWSLKTMTAWEYIPNRERINRSSFKIDF